MKMNHALLILTGCFALGRLLQHYRQLWRSH